MVLFFSISHCSIAFSSVDYFIRVSASLIMTLTLMTLTGLCWLGFLFFFIF